MKHLFSSALNWIAVSATIGLKVVGAQPRITRMLSFSSAQIIGPPASHNSVRVWVHVQVCATFRRDPAPIADIVMQEVLISLRTRGNLSDR